jgi:hypothetical protein
MDVRDAFIFPPLFGPSLHSFERLSNAGELDPQFVLRLAFADISDVLLNMPVLKCFPGNSAQLFFFFFFWLCNTVMMTAV